MGLVDFNAQLLVVEQQLKKAKLTPEQRTTLLNQRQVLQSKVRDAALQKGINGQVSQEQQKEAEELYAKIADQMNAIGEQLLSAESKKQEEATGKAQLKALGEKYPGLKMKEIPSIFSQPQSPTNSNENDLGIH